MYSRKAKSSFPPEFRGKALNEDIISAEHAVYSSADTKKLTSIPLAPLPQPWVPPPLEEESSVVEDPDAPRRLFSLVPLAPGQRKIAPL